jgi:tetratricopeptide (TPR) repeat protein
MRIAFALLLLIAAPAAAQDDAQEPDLSEPIVVTGIRIQDYRERLAACLARNCPTNEDADATLALAEALFLEGDYDAARTAVHASIRRNRDHTTGYPEPVSDLYRAHARLSRHMGQDRDALRSTHEILNALQEGIAREDHRHFTARLELSEMQMMMGRLNAARRELSQLARQARRAGREDVATLAELRSLLYEHIANPHGPARSRLQELANETDPARRLQSVGAKLLLARLYRDEGDAERADALLAEVGRGSSRHRRLLHSPEYVLQTQEARFDASDQVEIGTAVRFGNTLGRLPENYDGKWIDVGFWVLPDGSVSSLEVVRAGAPHDWAEPLLGSIRGRHYSAAEEASYRLERYTYTAEYETATGTRVRTRSPRARIEYLDLTVNDPPPPPPSARNQ